MSGVSRLGKAMSRAKASQHEKFIAFKRAHGTLNQFLDEANYLAAYVVGFSIIEDRITAMYSVLRSTSTDRPAQKELDRTSFSAKVGALKRANDIGFPEAELLLAEAKQRNELTHSAMWNLDRFDHIVVQRVIALAKLADKLRSRQKSKFGK
jgi:hypothetical protein